MQKIINKTKGFIFNVYPIILSLFIMMLGFSIMFLSGCLDPQVKANASADIDTNVRAKAEIKTDVSAVNASDNSKKEAKMDIENSGSTIEKQSQTSNIGTLSGGAPYLLTAIIVMVILYYRMQIKREKGRIQEEKSDHEFTINLLKEILRKNGNTDAQITKKIETAKINKK